MLDQPVTLSVVSHRQNALVNELLRDLARQVPGAMTIVLTENVRDGQPLDTVAGAHRVELIVNRQAKGFGANHNAAFHRTTAPVFVVLNPDIRLQQDPFAALSARLNDAQTAAVGPLVRSPQGRLEDSARKFPTALSLLKKAFS